MSSRAARPWFVAATLGVAVGGSAPDTRASQALAMDLGALTKEADQVAVVEVLSTKSAWDAGRRRILTTIELKVAEAWKGSVRGDGRFTIVQPGGIVDDVEMRVHGMPSFEAGERAVVFLRGGKAPTVVGLAQGKRPLRWSAAEKQWMVDVPDLSGLTTVDDRAAAAPERPVAVPLDELRRRVRRVLGK